MFGKKDPKMFSEEPPKAQRHSPLDITGFIGKGMRIEGKMDFDGAGRIDGRFKGEIKGNGTLLVGEEAVIEGDISVNNAIVSGEVRGVLTAKDKVELRPPAKMLGDIKTPTLIISEGVIFEGNSIMTKKESVAQIRPISASASTGVSAGPGTAANLNKDEKDNKAEEPKRPEAR